MNTFTTQILIGIVVFLVVFLIGFSIIFLRSRNKSKSLDVRMAGVFEDDPLVDKAAEKSGFFKFLQKLGVAGSSAAFFSWVSCRR